MGNGAWAVSKGAWAMGKGRAGEARALRYGMRVLLLQVGHTFEEIARERGDYDRWFREGLGLSERELEVVRSGKIVMARGAALT